MKSFIPGQIPKGTLAEIKRLNHQFLNSITEAPEETAFRQDCYDRWVKSCAPKRVDGSSN